MLLILVSLIHLHPLRFTACRCGSGLLGSAGVGLFEKVATVTVELVSKQDVCAATALFPHPWFPRRVRVYPFCALLIALCYPSTSQCSQLTVPQAHANGRRIPRYFAWRSNGLALWWSSHVALLGRVWRSVALHRRDSTSPFRIWRLWWTARHVRRRI
jgi:hypothetical protein